MASSPSAREPGPSVRRADLTGRERHLRGAMQAMARIAARFARAGRRTLPFMVRRRTRLLPQGVAIVDGAAIAEDHGRGVRLEVSLESSETAGWAGLVINAEGLAVVLEGTLGAAGGETKALGDEISTAARALATRIARSLAQDLATAIREEVGLSLGVASARSVSPDDPSEGQNSDGLRVDCLFEGASSSAWIALVVSAEALEAAARDNEEPTPVQGDPAVAESMRDVEVEVVAELGTATLGLRRLLALRVGDVVRLPTAVDDVIRVRVAGVPKLFAAPVASRGQIAIEIRGRHED